MFARVRYLGRSQRHIPCRFDATRDFSLSSSFVQFAQTLPPDIPQYSVAIILLTLASRVAFTLPVSIWAKRRKWRTQEIVKPELRVYSKELQREVTIFRSKGNSVEDAKKFYLQAMMSKKKQLDQAHHTKPLVTFLVPPLLHIPVLLAATLTLYEACHDPSPLSAETFLTLAPLSEVDRTALMPIALGMIGYANIEGHKWLFKDSSQSQSPGAKNQVQIEQGKDGNKSVELTLKPASIGLSILRSLSLVRIGIALFAPGGVVLYWITSALYSTLEMVGFNLYEKRRSKILPVQPTSRPRDKLKEVRDQPRRR